MTKHPDFTMMTGRLSNQTLLIRNKDGDVVRLVCDNTAGCAVLHAAINSSLILFEVLKKKGA